jgi:hypothetical protein
VTKGNAFEMPTGLPEALKEAVIVPKVDAYSLHASIRYVANKIGYSYSQSGPDFSLLDTKVPFAEPVPAYEFLWYAGNVRGLPISVGIHGSGSIVVTSKKP